MRLPKTLFSGFNLLKKSHLALNGDQSADSLLYFQNILNSAQPSTPEDVLLHSFVKGLYNENRHKFLAFIRNTKYECLVLWTESRDIANTFGILDTAYVKWNGKDTLYTVTPHNRGGVNTTSPVTRQTKYIRQLPVYNVSPEVNSQPSSSETVVPTNNLNHNGKWGDDEEDNNEVSGR